MQSLASLPSFMQRVAVLGVPPICAMCAASLPDEVPEPRGRRFSGTVLDRRLARSGLPEPLREQRLDALDASGERWQLIDACRQWAEPGAGHALYLFGEVGTGKTTLAAAALQAMAVHRDVRWTSAPALMVRLGDDFGSEHRERAMAALLGDDPLVLDDLGHERRSDTARAQLFAAIDERIVRGIPLLVTSNFPPSDLGDSYGQWLASRLVGAARPYRVLGADRRLSNT